MRFSSLAPAAILAATVSCGPVTLQLSGRPVDRRLQRVQPRAPPRAVHLPLTDWIKHNADLQWYTNITIGTPPQTFTVLIDTGSPDVLIPRSNCTTCGTHSRFDSNKSSTFSPLPGRYSQFLFGTGGDTIPFIVYQGANCSRVTDAISIGGLTVPTQQFDLCDVYGSALSSQPMDGIIGLGPADSVIHESGSFYWNLYSSGQLPGPEFGIYNIPGAKYGAEITLGGTDPTKYDAPITTLPLNKAFSIHAEQWVMDIPAMYINGKPIPDSSNGDQPRQPAAAIMDSGTSFMMVPDLDYTKDIYAQISPDIQPIDDAGTWGAACSKVNAAAKDVTITMGRDGKLLNVTLPKETFNLGEYPGKPGVCQAVFVSSQDPSVAADGTPGWVFGSPLLKYYYTVWNGVDLTVGFATPKTAQKCP